MKRTTGPGKLRIVGGNWRGRKLPVPAHPRLRPTPDRVRETLFNWLQPFIQDSKCLDLFAGSGALGIEAISRGAGSVDLVEQDRDLVDSLAAIIGLLDTEKAVVHEGNALTWLTDNVQQYDIVFLDPPFDAGIVEQAIDSLVSGQHLKPGSLVYVESEPGLRIDYRELKEFKLSQAGQVQYRLFKYQEEKT